MLHEEGTKDDLTFDHDYFQYALMDEPKEKLYTKGFS